MKVYFLLLLTLAQTAVAQIRFSTEVETGVNFSGLPKTIRWSEYKGKSVEKLKTVASPMIGVSSRISLKNVSLTGGVQFHRVGDVEYWRREGVNLLRGGTYESEEWKVMKLDRFSFPLAVGYDFHIRNFFGSFSIGYKPVYYTRGAYSEKYTYRENAIVIHSSSETDDPFSPDHFITAMRRQTHLFTSFSIKLRDKLWVAVSYSPPYTVLSYTETEGELESCIWSCNVYQKSDYSLTIQYRLIELSSGKPKAE